MAKYGNFVGVENLVLSNKEIGNIKEHFCNLISNYPLLAKVKLVFDKLDITDMGIHINFVCPPIKKRNLQKSRITFKGITFSLYKQKGYLEEIKEIDNRKQWIKDYDNVPEYQYACFLRCDGTETLYKCRRTDIMVLINHFDYDTDYKNFIFRESLNDLVKKLQ